MVVDVITAVDPGLEATPPRHMSVALPALRNHAGAGSSASFDDFRGEQILGIIPAYLESKNISSEPKPPPTKSFNIAEAPIDQRNSNQHGFGLPKILNIRIIRGNNGIGMLPVDSKLLLAFAHSLVRLERNFAGRIPCANS